jgi:hypothetical protein
MKIAIHYTQPALTPQAITKFYEKICSHHLERRGAAERELGGFKNDSL